MNDIRRTILWVVFAFSSVLLWDKWQIHNGRQATFFPTPTPVSSTQGAVEKKDAGAGVPAPSTAIVGAASTPLAAAPLPGTANVPALHNAPLIVLNTDVLKLSIDPAGASIVRAEFLKHLDLKEKGKNFVLLDRSAERLGWRVNQ